MKISEQASHFLCYPLEVYISYLVSSVPRPPRAFYKVVFQLLDDGQMEIAPPPANSLPMLELDLGYLARSLSPENVIQVFGLIVLERHVLFVSNQLEVLTPTIEAFLALLYPFKCQAICQPVLPDAMIPLLQTSVPFLAGIHRSQYDTVLQLVNVSIWVVHLDEDRVFMKLVV